MAISLKHLFTSPKSDGSDSTLVQPSNWNAEHVLTQATARLLGRTTAGTGPTEEISVSADFTLAAGTLSLAADFLVAGDNLSDLGNAATARGNLGVAIGSDVQAWDADLDAVAAMATNGLLVRTGAAAFATRSIEVGSGLSITDADGIGANPRITGSVLFPGLAVDRTNGTPGMMSGVRLFGSVQAFQNFGPVVEAVAAGDAAIEFTFADTDAIGYTFFFSNVIPSSDDVSLLCRLSEGGSFVTSASSYQWRVMGLRNSPATDDFDGATADHIVLIQRMGSASGEDGVSGHLTVYNPALVRRTQLVGALTGLDQDGIMRASTAWAMRNAAAATDGIRFYFSAGNLESGTIHVAPIRRFAP